MTISPALPALISCARMAIQRTWAYRARMVLWICRNMLMLFMLRMVWTAVYGDREIMNGVTLSAMILYVTIAMLQQYLIEPVAMFELDARIQRGTVAGDLIRPVGLIPQLLAYDVGFLIGRIPLIAMILPIAAIVGSLQLPPTFGASIGFLISLLLAYALNLLVWLPVGMLGFWTLSTGGLRFLLFSVLSFVSGQMVPLWFIPGYLRTVLEWMPFQGMAFAPLSIYVGQTTGNDILQTIAVQLIWIVILSFGVTWLWRRARNVVTIQGG